MRVDEAFGVTLTFAYNAAGDRVSVQDNLAGGATLTSTYDSDNRLTSRELGTAMQALRIDQTWTADGQLATQTRYADLAGTTAVGARSIGYDTAGQVREIQHTNGSGTTLEDFQYQYDADGHVTSEADHLQTGTSTYATTTSYSYLANGELATAGTASYTYNATGTRNNDSFVPGPDNQLQTDGTWTFTYDNDGNVTKKSKGASAETWTYGYDNEDHMLWAEDRATDGGTLVTRVDYTYDVFGNRLSETITPSVGPAVATHYVLDGWSVSLDASGDPASYTGNENWKVWATLDGSNMLQARYIQGDGVNEVLARLSSSGTAWYLTDNLQSVRGLTDGSGR